MARLVGIMALFGLLSISVDYSLANEPQATDGPRSSSSRTATGVSPTEALAFVAPAPAPEPTRSATRANWSFGVYTVGDSTDPKVARFDRDLTARTPLFVEDERLPDDAPTYLRSIQGEITPGLYATELNTEGCSYELWRVMKRTRENRVIGEDYLQSGRMLVSINGIEPDWFTSTAACGEWFEWRPRTDPGAPADNGDYWAGDLARGLWEVPSGCLWEKVAGFRGAALRDVVENGRGPQLLLVDEDTVGLRLRGCEEPITLLSLSGATRR